MCDCASCEYTDKFSGWDFTKKRAQPWRFVADKSKGGFDRWPRGEPAGAASSARAYRAHAVHCGADGLPRPYKPEVGRPPQFPAWMRGNGPIPPAPKFVLDWINRKTGPAVAEPARPETPAKAPQHLPEPDRRPEPATIYAMPKRTETKRPRGRPELPGRRVVIKLSEEQIKRAAKLGGGKVAAGIRKAIAQSG